MGLCITLDELKSTFFSILGKYNLKAINPANAKELLIINRKDNRTSEIFNIDPIKKKAINNVPQKQSSTTSSKHKVVNSGSHTSFEGLVENENERIIHQTIDYFKSVDINNSDLEALIEALDLVVFALDALINDT